MDLPTLEPHVNQVEAAKKVILLHLLTCPPVIEGPGHYGTPIRDLLSGNQFQGVMLMTCRTYVQEKARYTQQWLGENFEELQADGNVGLAKRVIERRMYENIETLSMVYQQLSLKEVEKRLNSPEEMKDSSADPESILRSLI